MYFSIPKQSVIEGCVESGHGGLQLTSRRHTFALVPGGVKLQPGERVTLKGKKRKKHDGLQDFEVRTLIKDGGSCTGHS